MSAIETFYVALGLASIALVVWLNRALFRGVPLSGLEAAYHLAGAAALLVGWYFNLQYFRLYGDEAGWVHWTKLLFVNPASASGAQDLIIANVILFPLWTIVDGRRSKMRASWIYFPVSLITSFAFAMALFLAMRDRQLRWNSGSPR
jgi:Terpene cyclase DEP1